MFRRWLIRSVFLLLPVLCLVGYGPAISLGHTRRGSICWAGTYNGRILLAAGNWLLATDDGWYAQRFPWLVGSRRLYSIDQALDIRHCDYSFHCLGFAFVSGPTMSLEPFAAAAIPLWAPIVFLACLALLVWHKTRPKKPAGRFPVEVANPKP